MLLRVSYYLYNPSTELCITLIKLISFELDISSLLHVKVVLLPS